MADSHSPRMPALDSHAAQALRRAASAAGARRVTLADLRRALGEPGPPIANPVELATDGPLGRAIARAGRLAAEAGEPLVSAARLYEALVEAEASALGLDLDRLRYARAVARRIHGPDPRRRRGEVVVPIVERAEEEGS